MVSVPSLQDSPNQRSPSHSPPSMARSPSTSRYRPHPSTRHNVVKGRYITSNDPRGYIPVYEYPLNGQWIMMDIDDGYILWTGIWKALGNSKADIVKMVDSHPDLSAVIRRVRGGYLKIQGTWMPYESALELARRVAWPIRDDLVPLFGPTFPSECLSPDQPGYGQVITPRNRRRMRRSNANVQATTIPRRRPSFPDGGAIFASSELSPVSSQSRAWREDVSPGGAIHLPRHHRSRSQTELDKDHGPNRASPGSSSRYNPYPHPHPTTPTTRSLPPLSIPSTRGTSRSEQDNLRLAPIRPGPISPRSPISPYTLPSLTEMEDLRGSSSTDSKAVLKRLQAGDTVYPVPARLGSSAGHSVQEILGKCQRDFLLSK